MSFAIQKIENVVDSENVTVTTAASTILSLLTNYPKWDFQQIRLTNNGNFPIYLNFSVTGGPNVNSSIFYAELGPGQNFNDLIGRGAFANLYAVAPAGNSALNVVIGS